MSKRARNSKRSRVLYGMYVVGVTRVFCNEKPSNQKRMARNILLKNTPPLSSRKDENGKYTNLYIPVFFEKDLDKPENNSLIRLQEDLLFPEIRGMNEFPSMLSNGTI